MDNVPAARLDVSLGARSYQILIEQGLIGRAGELLGEYARERRLIVISDENVWKAQGETLATALGLDGLRCEPIVLPPGEASKSFASLSALIDRLLDLGVERSDHLVAFGGGVIGDLVGFASAIVNRGCQFVQIPTTLLAQVDSSVGGKTGINVKAGKNLVGAFHQPSLVLIDPECLDTLPDREVRAGYAEVAKYGLINDPDFFAWCEKNGARLLDGDAEARAHAILTSCASKAKIVAEDELETSGRRALLNLGHTFGHALEAETGFSDRLLHGEAVAAGMVMAFAFSVRQGICPPEDAERVRKHIAAAGLPTSLQDIGIAADGRTLVGHMMHDKKKAGGRLPFILVRGIGAAYVDKDVDLGEVEAFLDAPGLNQADRPG
jgi:3-dehydroquinate synthase